MKNSIGLILLFISSLSFGSTTYDIECVSDEAYTDLGSANLKLKSKITVNGENNYVLDRGSFQFFIEDAWTDQNVSVDSIENYKKYNPRVYKGYAKFPSISREFFGKVDFIVPHEALLTGANSFTGVFILTWVEDHWGGTITAECELEAPVL